MKVELTIGTAIKHKTLRLIEDIEKTSKSNVPDKGILYKAIDEEAEETQEDTITVTV